MTSRPGEKSVERVAADANVILSAVAGKAALKVFTRSSVEIVSAAATLAEVREYLPRMAESYRIAPVLLESQLRLLAIPDDVHLLALALALDVPVWTNDRDFEGTVECYTTARLLKKLGL